MIVHVPRQAKRKANEMVPLKCPERSKYGDRPDLEGADQGKRTKIFTANRVRKLRAAAAKKKDEEEKLVDKCDVCFSEQEMSRSEKKKIYMRKKRAQIKAEDPQRWKQTMEESKERYTLCCRLVEILRFRVSALQEELARVRGEKHDQLSAPSSSNSGSISPQIDCE